MQLVSINIGQAQTITTPKKTVKTGIYKQSVNLPVQVSSEGLVGDVISNKRHHGSVDQAVYIYGGGDYDWWGGELNRPLALGTFGESP